MNECKGLSINQSSILSGVLVEILLTVYKREEFKNYEERALILFFDDYVKPELEELINGVLN